MLKCIKRGNLYQNLRIEGQLKFKKLHYSNHMMGYRPPQYRRGLKPYVPSKSHFYSNIDYPNIERNKKHVHGALTFYFFLQN